MRFISIVLTAAFASFANAHFQLQYPIPRGPFVQDSEPTFCDGYTNVTSNRTVFPISNGLFSFNSEHTQWTVGVIIATDQDPTSFSDFNSSSGYQFVVPYFQASGEGQYCFPVNISASSVSGVQDGANVTIQMIFDGGDGILYQCADLTLSANSTVPGNATAGCTNVTATATASAPTQTTTSSGAGRNAATALSVVVLALAGMASFL